MTTAVAEIKEPAREIAPSTAGKIMEQVAQGNLASLTPAERAVFLVDVCESLGLNPRTAPFAFITFDGKTQLYAKKDCTDQLRKLYGISIRIVLAQSTDDDSYEVIAEATTPTGRVDSSIGAVSLKGLIGQSRANFKMKAETKAKRRATLSICGLGFLDESEIDSIPGAVVDPPAKQIETIKPEKKISSEQIGDLAFLFNELKMKDSAIQDNLRAKYGVSKVPDLLASQAEKIIANLRARLDQVRNNKPTN